MKNQSKSKVEVEQRKSKEREVTIGGERFLFEPLVFPEFDTPNEFMN